MTLSIHSEQLLGQNPGATEQQGATQDEPRHMEVKGHAWSRVAAAYHGKDHQGREEPHDHITHQLHQLVPVEDKDTFTGGSTPREQLNLMP